jgi:hypothetical protein
MNNKSKAALYTLFLLIWVGAIIKVIETYPNESKYISAAIMVLGGIFWLYKLIYYILENK